MDVLAEEHRKLARHRTLKAGTITFNRAGGIDCRVRNLSEGGACLEVASQIGIPDGGARSSHRQKRRRARAERRN